jgi:two-component system, OmpR family, alkaline phosphatase synthesis response regulator PhoP
MFSFLHYYTTTLYHARPYIHKEYSMTEQELEAPWFQVGRFYLNPLTYTVVTPVGRVIELATTEFRVLSDLMSYAGQVRTNREIYRSVWGTVASAGTAANMVAVYIHGLRQKLEVDSAHPTSIVTVGRNGYLFQP